ncbi:MAG: DUF3048 domain-containing protein [Actinomycetota bacterium]
MSFRAASKFRVLFVATSGVLLLTLTACGIHPVGGKLPTKTESPEATATPTVSAVPTNSISGREGEDGRVLAVKIDDTFQAQPQIGIGDADVVYIEQVEAGLTRLLAIFSSTYPESIGPVRSARISDIDLLAQYGHVAFTYSGAQTKMLPVIRAANVQDLGAERESSQIYPRDPARNGPVDMLLKAQILMNRLTEQNVSIATSKNMGWNFGDAPASGNPTAAVSMFWPSNTYYASWSTKESRWLLFERGLPDMASDGKQLGPTTLVIQNVSITNSIYHDKFGGITPLSATVGAGTGYILRDGLRYAANWSRATAADGTTWTRPDGTPILFAPGQIWIALTNTAPFFTLPNVSPSPIETK